MSEALQHLFRDEADRLDVPAPPTVTIMRNAHRRLRARRSQRVVALAACTAVVVAGPFATNRLLEQHRRGTTPAPAVTPSVPASPAVAGTVTVSGSGIAGQAFGTDADEVLAAVSARLGTPDVSPDPQRYHRINGEAGWFEVPDDPMSPSWRYPVASVSCWGVLCLTFGGGDEASLRLRGWIVQDARAAGEGPPAPDVRLAGTGIRLGDSWKRLHAAYPGTIVQGGEGASLVVGRTPWPVVSDGVGGWRLSGAWDYSRPHQAPRDAVVIRLSAGEGPEPGCC